MTYLENGPTIESAQNGDVISEGLGGNIPKPIYYSVALQKGIDDINRNNTGEKVEIVADTKISLEECSADISDEVFQKLIIEKFDGINSVSELREIGEGMCKKTREAIQELVGVNPDGDFGPLSLKGIKNYIEKIQGNSKQLENNKNTVILGDNILDHMSHMSFNDAIDFIKTQPKENIKKIQIELKKYGYTGKIDGDFGPMSQRVYIKVAVNGPEDIGIRKLDKDIISNENKHMHFQKEMMFLRGLDVAETDRKVSNIKEGIPKFVDESDVKQYFLNGLYEIKKEFPHGIGSKWKLRARYNDTKLVSDIMQIVKAEGGLINLVKKSGGEKGQLFSNTVRDYTRNSSGYGSDVGLAQINTINLQYLEGAGIINSVQDLLDPQKNMKAMAFLYLKHGARIWHSTKSLRLHYN